MNEFSDDLSYDDEKYDVADPIESDAVLDQKLHVITGIDRKIAQKLAYAQSVNELVAMEIEKLEERRKYLEVSCQMYTQATDRKTIKLVNGTCKLTTQKEHWDWADNATVIDWAEKNKRLDLIRIKTLTTQSPDKDAIKEHFKKTGEIPDGCDVAEKITFAVKTLGGNLDKTTE